MKSSLRPAFLATVVTPWLAIVPAAARAQDTLRLETLHEQALSSDPRSRQLALLRSQSDLRLRSLTTERLPQFNVTGEATHQSDVTSVKLAIPGGGPPEPPKDRWQTQVNLQQLLYDGGSIGARRDIERARLTEARENVRTAQYRLRTEVNSAFFSAFLLQERIAELDALIGDLDARLDVVRARVREGAALPGEAAAIDAERLRAMQARSDARASRVASLTTLAQLSGTTVDERSMLALPDHRAAVDSARAAGGPDSVRARPEFAQFEGARERLARETRLAAAERRPKLYAFGQAGLGKPGLDQFNREPDEFYMAGVRLEWRFWNWGTTSRSQEILRLQQRIVDTEEAAFAEALERAVQIDLADMQRLEEAVQTDDRILALREQIERQARAQLAEGAITAADYVDARTDVLEARLSRQRHRVELAQARARYLTTLGLAPAAP